MNQLRGSKNISTLRQCSAFLPNVHCIGADCSVLWYVNEAPCTKLRRKEESKGYKEDKNGVVYVSTYILEVLRDQPIKLIQVVSDSELHQY